MLAGAAVWVGLVAGFLTAWLTTATPETAPRSSTPMQYVEPEPDRQIAIAPTQKRLEALRVAVLQEAQLRERPCPAATRQLLADLEDPAAGAQARGLAPQLVPLPDRPIPTAVRLKPDTIGVWSDGKCRYTFVAHDRDETVWWLTEASVDVRRQG